MIGAIARFFRWLATKLGAAVLIVVFGVAACAAWIYLRDNVDFDQWRQDMLRTLTGQRAQMETALADVRQRMTTLAAELTTEQERLHQADKVLDGLKQLDSTWDRYLGNRAQQQINDARRQSVTAQRKAIADRIAELQQQFTHATWERDGLLVGLGKLDVRYHAIEAKQSRILHYLEQTWNYPVGRGVLRLPLKVWVAVVLGFYFVGPTLGKTGLFFWLAPVVTRGRPVRFCEALAALPEISASQVAAELPVRPGERLWIKEKFLQGSDEGLQRKTRYLLDWRLPVTCVAAGLTELIEMRNPDAATPTEMTVTLSNQADPHSELAVITLPEGASIILRPSFIAGVVTGGSRLKIRRRWQLFRWQAWVTLQFRFFEFVGPCRLIVAGSRGVRAENLANRAGPGLPARRTNQDATIGFTPNLDYRPVRAETFWSYYRGMNPLFDDLFAGRGLFLCQQVATEGDAKRARKFWATVWQGALKVFGL